MGPSLLQFWEKMRERKVNHKAERIFHEAFQNTNIFNSVPKQADRRVTLYQTGKPR